MAAALVPVVKRGNSTTGKKSCGCPLSRFERDNNGPWPSANFLIRTADLEATLIDASVGARFGIYGKYTLHKPQVAVHLQARLLVEVFLLGLTISLLVNQ